MRTSWQLTLVVLSLGAMLVSGVGRAAAQEAVPAPQAFEAESDAIDVLARGPVHEAFAETISYDPVPGWVIDVQPPEPIDELPPSVAPEGENVIWIPGYWAWDEQREDFIWVSGLWRNVPPGQRWVPGYWQEVPDGYQWISGFWTAVETEALTYLPAPPESLENGPSVDPPADNYFWVPGNWIWQEVRYAWQPGYWAVEQPDWSWVPARYCYTPRGVVYVTGYWDYHLPYRGMLFAPVYFSRPIYTAASYYYTPASIVNISLLTTHLFVWPRHHHYYFGNYYDPFYADRGIYPWFRYGRSHRGYDPIFAYHHRQHRHRDRDWYDQLEDRHRYYKENESARPRNTVLAELQRRQRADRDGRDRDGRRDEQLVQRLEDYRRSGEGRSERFEQISDDRRQEMRQYAQQMGDLRQQRSRSERLSEVAQAQRGEQAGREGRDNRADREARGRFELPDDAMQARRQALAAQQRERSEGRQGRQALEDRVGRLGEQAREQARGEQARQQERGEFAREQARQQGRQPFGGEREDQARDARERMEQMRQSRDGRPFADRPDFRDRDGGPAPEQQAREAREAAQPDAQRQRLEQLRESQQAGQTPFGDRGRDSAFGQRTRDAGEAARLQQLQQRAAQQQAGQQRSAQQRMQQLRDQQQRQQRSFADRPGSQPQFEQRGFGPREQPQQQQQQRRFDPGAFQPRGDAAQGRSFDRGRSPSVERRQFDPGAMQQRSFDRGPSGPSRQQEMLRGLQQRSQSAQPQGRSFDRGSIQRSPSRSSGPRISSPDRGGGDRSPSRGGGGGRGRGGRERD